VSAYISHAVDLASRVIFDIECDERSYDRTTGLMLPAKAEAIVIQKAELARLRITWLNDSTGDHSDIALPKAA